MIQVIKKINIAIVFAVITILVTGCVKKEEKTLTLVSNAWIGYAPIFYASQKGYLKDLDIKVLPVVSLAEAKDVFLTGKADLVTTTQHEYYAIKEEIKDIMPIILLDRSDGGDMILSNKKIDELKKADKIYTYLETDSINYELLKEFLKNNSIKKDKIVFYNKDQSSISNLKYSDKPTLIVTYIPYDVFLKKNGYFEVASTKDINSLVVIDSICCRKSTLDKNRDRLKKLKQVINRSIKEITSNKKESYKLVAPYLDNISYSEYAKSFNFISWIVNPTDNVLKVLKPMGYKKEELLK